MLRSSEHRPPAYFVYNSTQSDEDSPRRVDIDVRRRSKEDLLDLNRRIEGAEREKREERQIRHTGFFVRQALKPDRRGNYTAGHKIAPEEKLRREAR